MNPPSTDVAVRNKASENGEGAMQIIQEHSLFATGASFIPLFGVDIAAITAVQTRMVKKLCDLYGIEFDAHMTRTALTSLAIVSLSQLTVLVLSKLGEASSSFQSFAGTLTKAAITGLFTAEVGQVYKLHFDKGGNLEDLSLDNFREYIAEQVETGKFDPKQFSTLSGQFNYLFKPYISGR